MDTAPPPHLQPLTEPRPAVQGTPRAAVGAVVPYTRRIVTWDPLTRQPSIANVPTLTHAQVSQVALAAASQLYVDPNDELAIELGLPPSRFYGLTNLEVMLIRQAENAARTGDGQEVERILDRIVGRPKTTAEVFKTSVTYEDKIRAIAAKVQDAEVIEEIS